MATADKLTLDYGPLGRADQIIGGTDTVTGGTGILGNKLLVADTTVDGAYKLASEGAGATALLLDDAVNGSPARIATGGQQKVRVAEAITRGADLVVGSEGRVKAAVANAPRIGQALEAATAANDIITFVFLPKLEDTTA